MNNYVVVTKQYKDIRTAANAGYPDEWPAECEEFQSLKEAVEKHPGKPLFTVSDYKHYAAGLALGHSLIPQPSAKPWWKFWRKT